MGRVGGESEYAQNILYVILKEQIEMRTKDKGMLQNKVRKN